MITSTIGSFQVFTQAYVWGGGAGGGQRDSLLFYVLYLYQRAFNELKMGYASALAWILFIIILVLTLIAHRTAGKRVTYVG